MKKRKSYLNVLTPQNNGGCCSPKTVKIEESTKACCEQPVDNTSCCDKNETKEVNIQKTGCC